MFIFLTSLIIDIIIEIMKKQRLSIIFYCYNEAPLINDIITDFIPISKKITKSYALEVIFIDDGSSDNTLLNIKKNIHKLPSGKVISHPKNLGVGGALRSGITAAKYELIMTIPGELAFPLEEIPVMLSEFDNHTDMIIASYNHPESTTINVPAQRLFLSRSLTFLYQIALLIRTGKKPHLHTISSGFRLYRGDLIRNIPFQTNGFLANSEIMVRALLKKANIKEHVTTLMWRKKGTKSKMKIKRTIISHLSFLYKIIFNKLNN